MAGASSAAGLLKQHPSCANEYKTTIKDKLKELHVYFFLKLQDLGDVESPVQEQNAIESKA